MPKMVNRHGADISVLQGLFQRTVFMLQNGIKPVYVFDGIPPENKRLKVSKDGKVRSNRKANPLPTPGSDNIKDLKTLLRYLGVPIIQAPSEAEATCAHLVVKGIAWGAVTEDMDALPFNCNRLIRNLTAKKKIEVKEYNLQEILKHLNLSREQFVDLCILLGCDYTGKISGLGKKKALKMIQTYKNIEGIQQVIPQDRIPPDFDYNAARRQFLHPVVKEVKPEDLKWTQPDNNKVRQFLSQEKCLKWSRVGSVLEKLHSVQTQKPQKRKKSKTTEASPSKQMKITDMFAVKKSARQAKSHHSPSME
ncbi:flap endonuclease 1-like isoform X2 [Bufo bufo]|uniref:flap endonuclease 1-like isoform X2 n=1 Tax=Bufo bufo TaxID=8384 RepID=UPI001ABEBB42|nr:flap endonuclease 1-like isoform X2 [Bufo bufo]